MSVSTGTNSIGYALERANMVAFDEMCRQLAFYTSGDRCVRRSASSPIRPPFLHPPLAPSSILRSGNFDVIVLVFTLVTYYDTATSPWLASFARGVVAAVNVKLVENALKVPGVSPLV